MVKARLLRRVPDDDGVAGVLLGLFLLVWLVGRTFVTYRAVFHSDVRVAALMWLVPWPGYVVRRGLPGEAILTLAGWIGIDPRWVVVSLFVGLSVLLAVLLWVLGRPAARVALPLLASPAALPFMLDKMVAARPEYLFYVHLVLVALLVRAGRDRIAAALAQVGAVLWPFVHEGVALFAPWLLAPRLLRDGGRSPVGSVAAFFGLWLAAMVTIVVIAQVARGPQVVVDICATIVARAPEIGGMAKCPEAGPVGYYALDAGDAIALVIRGIAKLSQDEVYAVAYLIILSISLLAFLYRSESFVLSRALTNMKWYSIIMALPVGLFALGYDWGRWIHIFYTFSVVLILWTLTLPRNVDTSPQPSPVLRETPCLRAALWWLLVLQPLFWRFDHLAGVDSGLLGILQSAVAFRILAIFGLDGELI